MQSQFPETLDEHARAVWAAKILAAHEHRDNKRWGVVATEIFSSDGGSSGTQIEVIPKDKFLINFSLTADEAFAIAYSYANKPRP